MKILLVDDEDSLRIPLHEDLFDAGFTVISVDSPIPALKHLNERKFDVVITDLKMKEMDGIQFLTKIKKIFPNVFVILITAFGSVKTAVEAMKLGAYDFFLKPFSTEKMIVILNRIKENIDIKKENIQLKDQLSEKYGFHQIIGKSKHMLDIYTTLKSVADSNSTALIIGETGTGKEMVANAIHFCSKRKGRPYIKVSCAILSKNVLENELFGHDKGAFTDAFSEKKGRFELADTGTIYLDDIDDMPLDIQVKLLRVLQEKEFERVGGTKTKKVDVRVIASSKIDLLEKVNKNEFRADLYYRLNVVPIHLPSLKNKKEDIPLLINEFIKKYCNQHLIISKEAMSRFLDYTWPGNVRELENLIERFSITVPDGYVEVSDLPIEIKNGIQCLDTIDLKEKSFSNIINDVEINIINKALKDCNGNISQTAKLLKMKATTLRSKIEKLSLKSQI